MSKWHISGFADEMSPELGIQLRELNRLGVGYMEPRTVDGCNISDLSQEQLAQMKSALAAAGVKVSSIGSPLGKISVEEDLGPHMEKLKRTLEIQKELDAPYVRMFSFYIPNGREPGSSGARCWTGWAKWQRRPPNGTESFSTKTRRAFTGTRPPAAWI